MDSKSPRVFSMRLGLVIYGSLDTLSGGYFYDRQLVNYLRAQGDSVEIFSLPWRNYAAHLADNFRFRLPPGLDLLIEDELNHPSLLAANRQRRDYPVVSLVHHLRASEERPAWQNAFYRLVEKNYLRGVDGFIFNSKTTRAVVRALIGDSRPAVLAYPPTDRFGPPLAENLVAARAARPGLLRILFLGSLIPRKGLDTLLTALASLPPQAFSLDIIGSTAADPPYAAQIARRAARLPFVRLHGALADAPLAEKLAAADLLVVPSSYEGFGIVYLEGMAFGLPAIGTTSGAAAEIISPGLTGYLIAPGDSHTLAAHLLELAQNRARLAELSRNALTRYRQQPVWAQSAADIRQFLLKMTGQK
ncbi:MAG: hypothetical protein OHK0031_13650 [Anaerolineales bacterium]